jgi:hypothetical protein
MPSKTGIFGEKLKLEMFFPTWDLPGKRKVGSSCLKQTTETFFFSDIALAKRMV